MQGKQKSMLPYWHFYQFFIYFMNHRMVTEQTCKRWPQINTFNIIQNQSNFKIILKGYKHLIQREATDRD